MAYAHEPQLVMRLRIKSAKDRAKEQPVIREVNGHYVISSGHMWLPGCYEDKRTAQYAFQFDDCTLRDLQESINPGGIITMAMLKTVRKEQPCKSASS